MRRARPVLLAMAFVSALVLTVAPGRTEPAEAATVPVGFSFEPVLSVQDVIFTSFAFAPDGRIFLADKAGVVRVYQNGSLLPTPFIDISADVNDYFEHGMTGLALDPNFPAQPYVYLYYVFDAPGMTPDGPGARFARIERITADAANTNVAAPSGARQVLFGGGADATAFEGTVPCRRNNAPVEDCISVASYRHGTGDLRFGPDGALYAAIGDGDRLPTGPLDLTEMVGKMFRINPATGDGYASNPWATTNLDANVSKVWAVGLRNAWRFSFHPTTGEMLIGDVGQDNWEAIYRGAAGANYGWPCYEGGNHIGPGYAATATCQALYAASPGIVPVYGYAHGGLRSSVTAGAWYTGTSYPPEYRGAHFWGDYGRGTLSTLHPNGAGYTPLPFGSGFGGDSIVSFGAQPGGDIHMLTLGGFNSASISGTLWRLRYTGPGNSPPTASISASPTQGNLPLAVTFSSAGSSDPNGDALTYNWSFGDGTTSTAANPTHTYTTSGVFSATLTVTDPSGATGLASTSISAGDVPTVTITAPADLSLARVGQVVRFTATATDQSGADLSGRITWSSRLYHGSHLHPDPIPVTTGPFVDVPISDHDDDIRFQMCAKATNLAGVASAETCRSVVVEMTPIRIESTPAGLGLSLHGTTGPTPFTLNVNTGSVRQVVAPPVIGCQAFQSWSDGGAATHTITADAARTLTAVYAPVPSCVVGGELRVSTAPTRTPSDPLAGATLPTTGSRYLFFQEAGPFVSVAFWLDNPAMTGSALHFESLAPFDYVGGSVTTASALDMATLPPGSHQVTARGTRADGTVFVTTATFTVGGTGGTTTTTTAPTTTTTAPTTTTTAPTTTTTTTGTPGGELRVAEASTRAPSAALTGLSLPATGTRYFFFQEAGTYTSVAFWLDNPAMTGNPARIESLAPFDFAGGSVTAANGTSLSGLAPGNHQLTARGTRPDGSVVVVTASFTVGGAATTTTTAPTTTTTAPTTTTTAPTTTTTAPTTTTTTAPPAGVDVLRVSASSTRAPAVNLAGQTLSRSSSHYVFLSAGTPGCVRVDFWLDNPAMTTTPQRVEATAPWDYAGGGTATAFPWSPTNLGAGTHSITARCTVATGPARVTTASFTLT